MLSRLFSFDFARCRVRSRMAVFLAVSALLPLSPLLAQDDAEAALAKTKAPATPAWLDTAVIYEIFPRAFSPEGTLNAVTAKLDQLHELGVNVLWLMPISPIGKLHRLGRLGSPYSIEDYYAVDPALGTKADLAHLIEAAHARHMRVLLDMVVNHTSWDSVMMTHPDFYQHNAAGRIISPHGWSDVAALNYDDPALVEYIDRMFLYWLQTFHVDGFRCDAASFVPTAFWDQLRPRLKQADPDVLLLAEASKPELMQHAFDLDYGWPMLATFNHIIQDEEPATAVHTTLDEQQTKFPRGTEHMLISDDHDERRATVRFGVKGALAASALVFTLPGIPLLYNGMEVSDATESGGPEMFEKVDIDWAAGSMFRDTPPFYKALLALRTSSPALRRGDLTWLHNSDEQHVVSFVRHSAEETDLVTVNLANTPFRGTVEIASPRDASWQEVPLAPPARHERSGDAAPAKEAPALPSLSLDPFGVRIFRLLPVSPQ